MKPNIIEEQHPSKIVAVYENEFKAKQAAEKLINTAEISEDQFNIVAPEDRQFERKIEPETQAVGKTLLASHLMLGLIGMVTGLLVASSLIIAGTQFAVSSPIMLIIATGTLGTFMGLLVAGAVSLRPDHDSVVNKARDATHHNKWSVIVHAKDRQQIQQAKKVMKDSAVRFAETF
ncbi:hypothetical protein Q4574_19585 [Aliiglaciecola sp. 3_MG-2023]|uniref:hypothetical protein n=1 Tax=Aliiglaciecola sp. 3_MG-2023 TaxID=3062644 RepID=UPI0026E337BE|nr:hypothetical protein [Aliiglaciecola sp. 3_MG-2023]MDO6695511.1 hypothetical protein [Aliiglaciecola sp. 3_MG-2023]